MLQKIVAVSIPEAERAALVELAGQVAEEPERGAQLVSVLLRLPDEARSDALRGAALSALLATSASSPAARRAEVTGKVLASYPQLSPALRGRVQSLLCSRADSARTFLRAVDHGKIAAREVPLDQLRRLTLLKDGEIDRLVNKHWGKVTPKTAGEKLTLMRNIQTALAGGKGDLARGKLLFQKQCAACHTLFGEGNKIGPDLTTADRKSRDFLVFNIIDPSAVIRPEYVAYDLELKDGRTMSGLVVESTEKTVTLVDAKNERSVIARQKIERLEASPVSLMPEKLLDSLEDQEVRDLFSYLQSDSGK